MAEWAREGGDMLALIEAAVPVPAPALPPEIAFLAAFGVDRALLIEARALALASGVTADRALLAAGALSAEQFYRLLAEHLGIEFLHQALPVAEGVAIEGVMEIEIVPLAPNGLGVDFAVAPRGPTLRLLLERFAPDRNRPQPRVAVTTPRRLAALVRRRHRHVIVREASHGLSDWNPRLSALAGWSFGQQLFGFALGFTTAVGLGAAPLSTGAALCLLCSMVFLGMVLVRLLATSVSPPATRKPLPRTPDDQLPIYTIVVPLFREARVVPDLAAALSRLDYPVLGSKLTKGGMAG